MTSNSLEHEFVSESHGHFDVGQIADAVHSYMDAEPAADWSPRKTRSDVVPAPTKPKVCLMGFSGTEFHVLRKDLHKLGVRISASKLNMSQLDCLAGLVRGSSYIIVNFDAFDSQSDGVGMLLEFRKYTRDIPLLLVSTKFSEDDFTAERRPICDASLRFPVSLPRLWRGLIEAWANNIEAGVQKLAGPAGKPALLIPKCH